jgi:hypothetical protein
MKIKIRPIGLVLGIFCQAQQNRQQQQPTQAKLIILSFQPHSSHHFPQNVFEGGIYR